jgi:hypothetical protein
LITFFSGVFISPLLLILCPLLNVAFAFAMPLLFILAIPLWNWQLQIGLAILSILQKMVLLSAKLTTFFPVWEVNFFFLLCFAFIYLRKKKSLVIAILVFCNGLNLESLKKTTLGSSEFVPQGREIKRMWKDDKLIVKWSDGKCEKLLTNGLWWEKCSPLRRSSRLISRKLSSL